jgi:Protein of unknown function (DUF3040)
MPLSEHEQRILAEIERRLLEEDPKFAHQVGSTFRAHLARRLKFAAVLFVVGLVMLAGFIKSVPLGVAGFVVMLLAFVEFWRTLRRRQMVDRTPAGGAAPQPPRRAPRGGLDAWWGRMTERWRQRWEERGGGPPGP